ncbi:MAG: ABC transporter ATP-binding protein [Desulfobacterota bacterium]|nr:ABC transporter ATP-binding protein [Thermodesulfobacteriota bacterium]MDW8001457.1 ABC transporter ATP-binding protein [Deltaproteobacteria bacterium]
MEILVEGLSFSYNSRPILENIEFHLDEGEILSILGPNGSGKTTLLKVLASIFAPKKGTVLVDGKELKKISAEERAKILGYVPQKSEGFDITVFEAVLSGRKPYIGFRVKKEDIEVVEEVIRVMELSELSSRSITRISGGEFQKVIIARALAQRPKVLLLDEPLSHLDLRNQMEIASLIRKVTKELRLVTIFVLHDINLAIRYSDLFMFLKKGQIEAFGRKEVLTRENVKRVFGVEVEIIDLHGLPYFIVKEGEGYEKEWIKAQ